MKGKIVKMKGRQMISWKSWMMLPFKNKLIWIILILAKWDGSGALKVASGLYGEGLGGADLDYSNLTVTDPPRVTLLNITSEYGDASFQASPLTKSLFQNDTIYVVPSTRNFLSFECAAKYPIFWNLAHSDIHPTMYHAVKVLSIRKFQDPYDPSTFLFKSIITLNGPAPKLSGNYSCQSTARHFIQSSILIFWESSAGSEFVHSKENLTVEVTSVHENIRLPCQLSDPVGQPKLKKEIDSSKNLYEELHLNESIDYLNGAGYVLKNLPNPLGTYKCLLDESEFVSVRVVQKNASHLNDYVFSYDDDRKQVKCCINGNISNARKPPKLYMMDCQHPSTCAIREHIPLESLAQQSYYWNQGKRRGNCAVYTLHQYHTGVLRCIGNGFSSYVEFIAPMETHRIWHSKRNTTTFFRWEEIDPQEMIAVSTFSSHDELYLYDRRRPTNSEKNIIYSKQSVQLTCHTSRYYFASGTFWMIRWKNQTMTQLADDDFRNNRQELEDFRYYVNRDRHMNTVFVTAELDMDSVICFAPVWNSSVWVSKIHHLYVNDSMAPLIQDTLEIVNYTWYANETDKTLSCTASGLPAPTFQWEKDNITILANTHNYNVFVPNVSSEVGTTSSPVTTTSTTTQATTTTVQPKATTTGDSANSPSPDDASTNNVDGGGDDTKQRLVLATSHSTVQISRVSFNTQGVFRCVATNVGGRATKEFYITVLEVKSWKVTGMLVGASIITVVLIIGIIYLLRKLYADRQEINQLGNTSSSPSVSFNDVMRSTVTGNGASHGIQSNNDTRNTGLGFGSRVALFLRNNRTNNTTSNNNSSRASGGGGVENSYHSGSYDNGMMTNNLIDTF